MSASPREADMESRDPTLAIKVGGIFGGTTLLLLGGISFKLALLRAVGVLRLRKIIRQRMILLRLG